jgi:bifunctional N-acetylglucosamine-1-phosphate-uridyltransferase/glucosamine-1-phosphate-acetyltransferase GlmU-like protein
VDKIFRERKVQELMLAGVTIEKPETVTIDSQRPHWRGFHRGAIRANSRQYRNRRRLPHRRLLIVENSTLADEVEIAPFTSVGFAHRNRRA